MFNHFFVKLHAEIPGQFSGVMSRITARENMYGLMFIESEKGL